jgi:hypothetical protein
MLKPAIQQCSAGDNTYHLFQVPSQRLLSGNTKKRNQVSAGMTDEEIVDLDD